MRIGRGRGWISSAARASRLLSIMLQRVSFTEPCLTSPAKTPPPAQTGCTKSNTTASAFWRDAMTGVCGSILAMATISATVFP